MDKVKFPYRSSTHLPFLHVVAESGAWEKYGLEVEYDKKISAARAHDAVLKGDVEFVGGNHISTYSRRARGDRWVYLGQTMNQIARQLVVRPDSGIDCVQDLREKVVGTRGHHPRLNDWLFLKQRGLDEDRDEVKIVQPSPGEDVGHGHDHGHVHEDDPETGTPLWQLIRDKQIDAAFMAPPSSVIAREAGLKVIEIEPLPMIYFTTLSSGEDFVQRHPDLVLRFLKGIIEGVHYFKTRPEQSIEIIKRRYTNEGAVSEDAARETYNYLARNIEPRLYPTMPAISNVYAEAVRLDKDALRVNPMELWDLHFIRQLDDEGFVANLYGNQRPVR